jgi:hypothetical protein
MRQSGGSGPWLASLVRKRCPLDAARALRDVDSRREGRPLPDLAEGRAPSALLQRSRRINWSCVTGTVAVVVVVVVNFSGTAAAEGACESQVSAHQVCLCVSRALTRRGRKRARRHWR